MSDGSSADPIASSMAGASQSLRDTAKWLVGGVVATAAGVFAGSSLTALGSLDWATNTLRLATAGVGILVGFFGLACILASAIQVLTRESMTFREIATPIDGEDEEIKELRDKLFKRYGGRLPRDAPTFEQYVEAVDAAGRRVEEAIERRAQTDRSDTDLIARARRDNAVWSADGSFLLVRARFDTLVRNLWWTTLLAIAGFGLFAWAANPPKPQPASPDCSTATQVGKI